MNNQNVLEGHANQETSIQAKMAEIRETRKRRKLKHLLPDDEYRQMAKDALGIEDDAPAMQQANAA